MSGLAYRARLLGPQTSLTLRISPVSVAKLTLCLAICVSSAPALAGDAAAVRSVF